MAPFSNIEQAVFYDDEEDNCSLESSPSSVSLQPQQRKSSINSSSCGTSSKSSSVSFASEAAVHAVLHINDYSLTERRDCWYGVEEMRQVRQEWKGIVHSMDRCNSMFFHVNDDDNDDYGLSLCVRGLEGKTCHGKRRRREARAASLEVVLDEQLYQGLEADDDDDRSSGFGSIMIAMAYHELTFPLQLEAYQQAQKDAKEAGYPSTEGERPRKFDFRAVRAKYFAANKNHKLCNSDDDDDGATVATTIMMDATDNLLLHERSTSIRKRLSSCFLPLTPKRYTRRVRPSPGFGNHHQRADI